MDESRLISITDPADPRLECFRNVRDKDLRGRDRLFMAESEMVIRRLIAQKAPLHALLLSPSGVRRLGDVLADLPGNVPAYVVELEAMCAITGFHIHRGVLATGYRPPADATSIDQLIAQLQGRDRLVVLIGESITNIDNMGGLFRTAAAFGVDGVVLDPTCCDPLYRKSIRVSMGHTLSLPRAESRNWPADLVRLKSALGLTLVAAETGTTAIPLWSMPESGRIGIVVGSEAHGLSDATLSECDAVCEIPMTKNVPSLNVATAASVFLYECQRRSGNRS